ncbi:MAG: HAD family phosphatase, partial [Erysipelotrichaceae bacterium]|nr:HAD family phosphatase [Erysipelotrichaceae bacterium]
DLGYKGDDRRILDVLGTTMQVTFEMLSDMLEGRYTPKEVEEVNNRYFLVDHPLPFKDIMFEDIPEVLEELKKMGLKMAVCSSSPLDIINESIDAMGIRKYFDLVVSGEDFTASKPDPAIYLYAAKHLGLKPEECIVYEDSAMGIGAGVNAGMFTIARTDKRFGQDQSKADLHVDNAKGLLAYVKKEIENGNSH